MKFFESSSYLIDKLISTDLNLINLRLVKSYGMFFFFITIFDKFRTYNFEMFESVIFNEEIVELIVAVVLERRLGIDNRGLR